MVSVQEPAPPDPREGRFLRVRLDLGYDGAPFSGWATQPGRRTVQGSLEAALELVFRRPVRLVVAGRTDAGVHARRQVAHLDVMEQEWSRLARRGADGPEVALLRRLRGTLSRVLKEESGAIVVHRVERVKGGFDARFSALWRRYSYCIADDPRDWDPVYRGTVWWYRKPLDAGRINRAAEKLLGLHDFLAFCKPREGATTVRELQEFRVRRVGRLLVATVRADAFCHTMVRALIGSAVQVGAGEQQESWLEERLYARVRDGRSVVAPPHPLVLEEVGYPGVEDFAARAEQTRAVREPGV